MVFYSTTIFGLAGFDQAIIGTSLVGVVNVVTTIITSNLIDRYGRKVLLLSGTYIMYVLLCVFFCVSLGVTINFHFFIILRIYND